MKGSFLAIFASGVMAVSVPVIAQNPQPAPSQNQPKLQRVQERHEEHPNIEAAIKHLDEAKRNLENAAHDFGGHRANALKHVNEALEECHRALQYDKH
jgi:hypothetical protein